MATLPIGIRAKTNRALPGGDKLCAPTLDGEPLGEISVTTGGRDQKKGRKVRQQLWAKRVELPAGRSIKAEASCIIAREIDAPAGAEMIPPTMTIANGRCVSDPMPCDSAAGSKPRPAISAVIKIGRSRATAPSTARTAALLRRRTLAQGLPATTR